MLSQVAHDNLMSPFTIKCAVVRGTVPRHYLAVARLFDCASPKVSCMEPKLKDDARPHERALLWPEMFSSSD
jgi:hypothetical protein